MKKISAIVLILLGGLHISFAQKILRGPYLQLATENSIMIRMATDFDSDLTIEYGKSFASKSNKFNAKGQGREFEIIISNLEPNTKYFYSVSSGTKTFASDSSYYFYTAPTKNSKKAMRFAAFGDCGTGSQGQRDVYNQVQKYFNNKPIDGWLLLGDNAYNYGWVSEYQSLFFDIFNGGLMKNSVLWPAPGNHDYGDKKWVDGTYPDYFRLFSVPTKAESGGVASHTKAYYSFDYGNVHFISLDSYGEESTRRMSDTLSKQYIWVKKDLEANKLPWTVVYFHHPPFSKGTHDSDEELELTLIRENLVKLLDKHKVDLVLSGHSHNYERSYLINNFRGKENEFKPDKHAVSMSSAKYNGTTNSCPYIKSDSGTVYLVAGTSGQLGYTKPGYPHNIMYYSNTEDLGAVIIEVEDNKMEVKYLTDKGLIKDNFVFFKDVNKKQNLETNCQNTLELKPSWKGKYFWNTGIKSNIPLILDSLSINQTYTVTDSLKCLKDEFNVKVTPLPKFDIAANTPVDENKLLTFTANAPYEAVFTWTGPDNYKSIGKTVKIDKVSLNSAGIYKAEAKVKKCEETATKLVEVIKFIPPPPPPPPLANNIDFNFNVSAFPNPSTNNIKVIVNVIKTGSYNLLIRDAMGKVIQTLNSVALTEGKSTLEIDTKKIIPNAGVYYLTIEGESQQKTVRFVKQ